MFPEWLSTQKHLIYVRVAWKGVEVGDPWNFSRPEGQWAFDSRSGLAEKFIGHLMAHGMLRLDIELDAPTDIMENEYGVKVPVVRTLGSLNRILRKITRYPRHLEGDLPFTPVGVRVNWVGAPTSRRSKQG
jgi:hypothetical protein